MESLCLKSKNYDVIEEYDKSLNECVISCVNGLNCGAKFNN